MGPESWFGLSFEPFLHIFNRVFRPADMIRMLAFKVCFLESRSRIARRKDFSPCYDSRVSRRSGSTKLPQESVNGRILSSCTEKISKVGHPWPRSFEQILVSFFNQIICDENFVKFSSENLCYMMFQS